MDFSGRKHEGKVHDGASQPRFPRFERHDHGLIESSAYRRSHASIRGIIEMQFKGSLGRLRGCG
jgi:hypothetical protein